MINLLTKIHNNLNYHNKINLFGYVVGLKTFVYLHP